MDLLNQELRGQPDKQKKLINAPSNRRPPKIYKNLINAPGVYSKHYGISYMLSKSRKLIRSYH